MDKELLKRFDAIRPYEPEELPEVYDRLLAHPQFQAVMNFLMPGVPIEAIGKKMRACKNSLEFQYAFSYDFVKNVLTKTATGFEMDASAIDNTRRYTFMSNHRDIVMDPSSLSIFLIDAKFTTTCEIAIGDNLLSLPWVKDLVRVNKSFIVERGLPMRQMLLSSKRLADYMHFAIAEKHENIWIAQREGRAKDSNDHTQEAILKMITMGGEGAIIDRLKQMHIVPLSLSYEYDPCDYLKAAEFQQKRDMPGWKKSAQDDVHSMQTGIMGYKGHVHFHCAPCIDDFLSTLDADMPKAELYQKIAAHIDHEIHRNYRLYPVNYVALDLLSGTQEHTDAYTAKQQQQFEQYIAGQLVKIDIPNKDETYLRERLLTMYANPAINYLTALK
uniref:1-acyl-sn-glycerol-3-phosphate acyltransferase n=1 Tax=Prevotella sp. GTC17260 TaxID=3236796 RepID=A0AB33JHW2_9BACT